MKIVDCRKKEYIEIARRGGDFEIQVKDLEGRVLYKGWYEMKRPYKEHFLELVDLFGKIQHKFKNQEENKNEV